MPDFQSFPAHSKELQRHIHQSHYRSRPRTSVRAQTDLDVLKRRHKFIREEKQAGDQEALSWEDQLAEKWYSKLFREFALIDLKHYKSGNIGLRWRTEDEVVSEIGERTCGSLRCDHHEPAEAEDLQRWHNKRQRKSEREERRSESASRSSHPGRARGRDDRDDIRKQADFVSLLEEEEEVLDDDGPLVCADLVPFQLDFSYVEDAEKQQALVKVMLCKRCQRKLSKARSSDRSR